MKKKIKVLLTVIIVAIILLGFSGSFTMHNGEVYSIFTTKQKPYESGHYMNYSINKAPGWCHTSGYLNVSSIHNHVFMNTSLMYQDILINNTEINKTIVKSVEFNESHGHFYYNNSIVYLPFFYTNKIITHIDDSKNKYIGDAYVNETKGNFTLQLITNPQGIFKYHAGKLVCFFGNETYPGIYEYEADTSMLYHFQGVNPLIDSILSLILYNGTQPIHMSLTLHKTNYIIFPIDWDYVALTYIVVFVLTFIVFIAPVIAIFGIYSYAKRRRRSK
ncbi:hypothetical protein [Ferroplasma sp.]|uniref:hypothetical protein n=1 Tax=Ferroplasma sp. TaxID=2591003 RepID=UPI00307E0004